MKYKLESKNNGKFSLYSERIEMYVMEDESLNEIKFAIAAEMLYKEKLELIKHMMTFPDGYLTLDGMVIIRKDAVA